MQNTMYIIQYTEHRTHYTVQVESAKIAKSETNVPYYLFPRESFCNGLIGLSTYVNGSTKTFLKKCKSSTDLQTDRQTHTQTNIAIESAQ